MKTKTRTKGAGRRRASVPRKAAAKPGEIPAWVRGAERGPVFEAGGIPMAEVSQAEHAARAERLNRKAQDRSAGRYGRMVVAEPAPVAAPAVDGQQVKPWEAIAVLPPAPAGSLRAVAEGWIRHLAGTGVVSRETAAVYVNDLSLAIEFFQGDCPVDEVEKDLPTFDESDLVKRSRRGHGKVKAAPTIARTRRVIRMAIAFAKQAVAS